ncbi:UMP kinase [Candidatus Pacearchaeota archaeon]|nr:UMP kinase [Candidatus Pacearchaeota archaeon]
MKKVLVISLGGSVIVPDKIDFVFLDKFKKLLEKHSRKFKFVIVCGGGSIARKYIDALVKEGADAENISEAGMRATRMNALFLMQFFGKRANSHLPKDMIDVRNNLFKNDFVLCGALRYSPDETSDGTAAKLAHFLKTDFINITNVDGLYTKDPKVFKDAKFIPSESWSDFKARISKMKFKAGQHFVLDQQAATIIMNYRIKTIIVDKDIENLGRLLAQKPFKGTILAG